MKIYHFHPVTKELLHHGQADPDPLEPGRWLVPAHATELSPPNAGDNQIAVFNGGDWELQPDHRGITYWLDHETSWRTTKIGDTPPSGASVERPAQPAPTSKEKVDAVDAARQALYRKEVDPLINESNIKRAMGENEQADSLMQQAIAKRLDIQSENPWPE